MSREQNAQNINFQNSQGMKMEDLRELICEFETDYYNETNPEQKDNFVSAFLEAIKIEIEIIERIS
jgi:uncharacterized protein YggL (DUF469 family)